MMTGFEHYPIDEFNQANMPRYETLISRVDNLFSDKQGNIEVIKFSGIDDSAQYPIATFSYNADGFQKIKSNLLIKSLYSIAQESIQPKTYYNQAEYRHTTFTIDESTSIDLVKCELFGLGLKTTSHDITIIDNLITKRLNLTRIGDKIESYQEIRPTKNELYEGMVKHLQKEDVFRVAKIAFGLLPDKQIFALSVELLFKYRYHLNREEIYRIIAEARKQASSFKNLTELSVDLTKPSANDLDDLIEMLSRLR